MRVAIHRRQSLGRAPSLAVMLLVRAGIGADEAWERGSRARGAATPEMPERRAWVDALSRD